MLRSECGHNNFILWPLAIPYINDQFKNIQCPFSQNVILRIYTMLHGALHLERVSHA